MRIQNHSRTTMTDALQPERKKSKQEVMSEVIAKSKGYKAERQHQKDLDEDLRDELDGELGDLRALLQEGPSDTSAYRPKPVSGENDAEYAQFVKTLAFEARAKPKDRTKTEDELAMEEKERLEQAEAKRLRRMRGEESEDEDTRGKRRKTDARRQGDDLDDDFVDDEEDEDLLGPGLTREHLEQQGKAARIAAEDGGEDEDEDEDDDDDDGDDPDSQDDDQSEDEDDDEEDGTPDLEDLDDEAPELVPADDDEIDLVRRSKPTSASSKKKTTEIPYTFICPETVEQFEDIMEPLDDAALPTVVQRIRAIHHPSLAQGNKEKLQVSLSVFPGRPSPDWRLGLFRSPTRLHPSPRLSPTASLCTDRSLDPPFGLSHQAQPDYCRHAMRRQDLVDAKESGSRSRSRHYQPCVTNLPRRSRANHTSTCWVSLVDE